MGLYDDIRILQHADQLARIEQGRWFDCPPLHVRLEPSEICNFRCRFCWWHNIDKRQGLANFNFNGRTLMERERLLALLDELAALGTKALSFTGAGDPLMYPDMAGILRKVVENGFIFGLTSNMAMPMSDELIEALTQARWLRWSMNAGTERTYLAVANPKSAATEGLFARLEANILRLVAAAGSRIAPPNFNASYVVTQINQGDVYEAARLASSLGVDSIAFRPDTPLERQGRANPYSAEVLKQIEKARRDFETTNFRVHSNLIRQDDVRRTNDPELVCFYSNHTAYIDAHGDIYPCCYTRYDARYVMGNILRRSFVEFWNAPERRLYYERLPQDGCPACGYGRINEALKPLYLKRLAAEDITVRRNNKDFFI